MSRVRVGSNRYGKQSASLSPSAYFVSQQGLSHFTTDVRMLRVVKDSPRHDVHELVGEMLLYGDFFSVFSDVDPRTFRGCF